MVNVEDTGLRGIFVQRPEDCRVMSLSYQTLLLQDKPLQFATHGAEREK